MWIQRAKRERYNREKQGFGTETIHVLLRGWLIASPVSIFLFSFFDELLFELFLFSFEFSLFFFSHGLVFLLFTNPVNIHLDRFSDILDLDK